MLEFGEDRINILRVFNNIRIALSSLDGTDNDEAIRHLDAALSWELLLINKRDSDG